MADPNAVLADIGAFNKEQMNHVEVSEKQVLPDKEQVESERKEAQLRQEIERVSEMQLKHVEVTEKVALPDAEAIAKEKQELKLLREIESGRDLKHVEVLERTCMPDAGAIAEEKATVGGLSNGHAAATAE